MFDILPHFTSRNLVKKELYPRPWHICSAWRGDGFEAQPKLKTLNFVPTAVVSNARH